MVNMDDVVARPRYTRRTIPGKRYKNNARDNDRLPRIILRQLLAALVLLLIIGIVKSINSPVTNFLSEKVRFALTQNLELQNIYGYIDKTVADLKSSIAPSTKETAQNKLQGTGAEEAGKTTTEGTDNAAKTTAPTVGVETSPSEGSVLSASYVQDTKAVSEMLAPVTGILSSNFGERKDPLTGSRKLHEGIDIEAVKGADIKAALGGTVEEAGTSPSYGNYIRLSHNGGLETIYAHCSELDVKKGMSVKQGEVIAKVGDSGASVGVHLHFEILQNGKPVNPLDYITLAAGENQG